MRAFAASLEAMTVARPPMQTEDRLPAQRRASLAYPEMREAAASDHEAEVSFPAGASLLWYSMEFAECIARYRLRR